MFVSQVSAKITLTTLLDVQDFILNNTYKGYVTAAVFLDLNKMVREPNVSPHK